MRITEVHEYQDQQWGIKYIPRKSSKGFMVYSLEMCYMVTIELDSDEVQVIINANLNQRAQILKTGDTLVSWDENTFHIRIRGGPSAEAAADKAEVWLKATLRKLS